MAGEEPTIKKVGWRRLLRNPVSMAGVALAIVSAANIFLFFLIDLIAAHPSPYIGILRLHGCSRVPDMRFSVDWFRRNAGTAEEIQGGSGGFGVPAA